MYPLKDFKNSGSYGSSIHRANDQHGWCSEISFRPNRRTNLRPEMQANSKAYAFAIATVLNRKEMFQQTLKKASVKKYNINLQFTNLKSRYYFHFISTNIPKKY